MIGIQEALNKAVEDNRKLEKEIERLNNLNKQLVEKCQKQEDRILSLELENQVLKTGVENQDRYSYGYR